jgi:hypothetical protein
MRTAIARAIIPIPRLPRAVILMAVGEGCEPIVSMVQMCFEMVMLHFALCSFRQRTYLFLATRIQSMYTNLVFGR